MKQQGRSNRGTLITTCGRGVLGRRFLAGDPRDARERPHRARSVDHIAQEFGGFALGFVYLRGRGNLLALIFLHAFIDLIPAN